MKADSAAVETARLNLAYTVIRAPISGRTGSLLVRQGNLVRANAATPLVVINQIRPILVRFSVPGARAAAGAALRRRAARSEVPGRPGGGRFGERRRRARSPSSTTPWTPRRAPCSSRRASPTRTRRSGRASTCARGSASTCEPNGAPDPRHGAGQPSRTAASSSWWTTRSRAQRRPVRDRPHRSTTRSWSTSGLQPGERVVTDGQSRLFEGARVLIKGAARGDRRPPPRRREATRERLRALHPPAGDDHAGHGRPSSSSAWSSYRLLPVNDLPTVDFPTHLGGGLASRARTRRPWRPRWRPRWSGSSPPSRASQT